jgi:hypothetical protein
MLGHAITTELQLLEAHRRAADLAAAFGSPSVQDSTGGHPVRTDLAPPSLDGRDRDHDGHVTVGRPAAA